jgi:hypothetical protein
MLRLRQFVQTRFNYSVVAIKKSQQRTAGSEDEPRHTKGDAQ